MGDLPILLKVSIASNKDYQTPTIISMNGLYLATFWGFKISTYIVIETLITHGLKHAGRRVVSDRMFGTCPIALSSQRAYRSIG